MVLYLDHNATTPMRPEAVAAMVEAARIGGNPSSVHGRGREVRRLVEAAREQVALAAGAVGSQLVFTSGGTEANHLALLGLPAASIVVSAVEHESALAAARRRGVTVAALPVDAGGLVQLDALDAMLAAAAKPVLLSVLLANNETGVIQPMAGIVAAARRHGAMVHTDAVQAFGKIEVDFAALGVHALSLSAHKIGGPQGSGVLILREGLELQPLLGGGGQERGLRAGTENVAGIAGFGAAARLIGDSLARAADLAAWRDRLEAGVREVAPAIRIWGGEAPRLPGTSCFGCTGFAAETQVIGLDLAGIAVSAGAACSAGKMRPSRVLRAMGADEAEAGSAIRVSLGWTTAEADVERFVEAWRGLHARQARPAGVRAAA